MSREDTVSIFVPTAQLRLAGSQENVARECYYELSHTARQRWGESVELEYGFVEDVVEDGHEEKPGLRFFATRRRVPA